VRSKNTVENLAMKSKGGSGRHAEEKFGSRGRTKKQGGEGREKEDRRKTNELLFL